MPRAIAIHLIINTLIVVLFVNSIISFATCIALIAIELVLCLTGVWGSLSEEEQ